jgi:hypothetical protein
MIAISGNLQIASRALPVRSLKACFNLQTIKGFRGRQNFLKNSLAIWSSPICSPKASPQFIPLTNLIICASTKRDNPATDGFLFRKAKLWGLNRREQLWICALVSTGIRQAERDLHNQSLDSCRVLREQDTGLAARYQSPTVIYRQQVICGIQGPKRKVPSGMGGLCC